VMVVRASVSLRLRAGGRRSRMGAAASSRKANKRARACACACVERKGSEWAGKEEGGDRQGRKVGRVGGWCGGLWLEAERRV
jgi:hypothetical protein